MKYLVVVSSGGKRTKYPEDMFDKNFLEAVEKYLEDYSDFESHKGFDLDDVEGQLSDMARMLGYCPDKTDYEVTVSRG